MAAEYLYNDLHLRHITTVGVDYAFGWESIGGLMTVFKKLGGTIDKAIWAPITTSDYSPYVTQIPQNTQAVFAVTVGAGGPRFTAAYQQFGLRAKIPLIGNTTVTDYSVLPSEDPNAITGVKIVAQYCDGITTPVNQKFADEYKASLRHLSRLLLGGGLHQGSDRDHRFEGAQRRYLQARQHREGAEVGHDRRAARPGQAELIDQLADPEYLRLRGAERERQPAQRARQDVPERPAVGAAVGERVARPFRA